MDDMILPQKKKKDLSIVRVLLSCQKKKKKKKSLAHALERIKDQCSTTLKPPRSQRKSASADSPFANNIYGEKQGIAWLGSL